MTRAKVVLELIADNKKFKGALDESKKSARDLGKTIDQTPQKVEKIAHAADKVPSSFKGIGVAAAAAAASIVALGAGAVVGLSKAIKAASEQEEALNSVSFALARAGANVRESLPDYEKFASRLQDVTGIGDEVTLKMLDLALAFGATKDGAKDVVTAATELSAATGKSLEESVRQVSKTLGGFAGELGEVNPAIKALTAEQLKAGEAARILIDQYGGSAANKLNTFSGALAATKGRFGDLLEQVGFLIIKNPIVIDSIREFGLVIKDLTKFIETNNPAMRRFISDGIELIIGDVPRATAAIKGLAEAYRGLIELVPLQSILNLFGETTKAASSQISVMERLSLAFLRVVEGITKFYQVLSFLPSALSEKLGFGKLNEGLEELDDKLDALQAKIGSKFGRADFSPAAPNAPARPGSGIASGVAAAASAVQSAPARAEEIAVQFVGPPRPDGLTEVEVVKSPELAKDLAKAQAEAQGQNLASALQAGMGIFGGAQGAGAAVGSGIGAAASLAGAGPLGGVVGQLATELAKGPDHVRDMINGFVDALPAVLDNIARAIPKVIEVLVDRAPDIIATLAEKSPAIIIALSKAALDPRIWVNVAIALVQALAGVFTAEIGRWGEDLGKFLDEIGDTIAQFPQAITNGILSIDAFFREDLPAIFTDFFDDLGKAFQELINQLTGKGKGTGKGLLGEAGANISDIFKGRKNINPLNNARGGFVRGSGISDTVPSLLTPGELVIDRETGPMLRSFLRSVDKGTEAPRETSGYSEALLNEILRVLKSPQQVTTKLMIDRKPIADLVLSLNRTNQRLTV